jgi:lysophospholipase L1-like esterase
MQKQSLLFIIVVLSTLYSLCFGAQISCIGDSWGAYGCPVLTKVIQSQNPETRILDYSKSGSQTTDWISTGKYYPILLNALAAANNDTQTYIWFSIGGNDFLRSKNPLSTIFEVSKNIVEVLKLIKNQRPNVTVVHFGYDFPNLSQDTLKAMNLTVTLVNEGCLTYNIVLNTIKLTQTNFQIVDIAGTLQKAGNVPNAPNLNLPSPVQFMRDAIHPNTEGFTFIMNTFYDKYWKFKLN